MTHLLAPQYRPRLPFRAVNVPGRIDYRSGMQRHHLLPCQLLSRRCFACLFAAVGLDCRAIDDFRCNGLLLPATDEAAVQLRLPLHRGPHRAYSDMVGQRVGQIELEWARCRMRYPQRATVDAVMRLNLLQGALRSYLLRACSARPRLHTRDPLGATPDFTRLDAIAGSLWAGTTLPEL